MRSLFLDTLLDADLESDALGWQYISGTLPDGRELDRMDNPQFEGYKFDPNGEFVRRWLPELARLPTEWIHHPWNAPPSVLQAAGIELGSNYPLPIVGIDAAKARLQEALTQMWQHEAASRAVIENGTEEGLGDSSDSAHLFGHNGFLKQGKCYAWKTTSQVVICWRGESYSHGNYETHLGSSSFTLPLSSSIVDGIYMVLL